jgi:hypothetical protein
MLIKTFDRLAKNMVSLVPLYECERLWKYGSAGNDLVANQES